MNVCHQLVRGFSLLEVVIAVGIFAGTVTVMLGLLPSLSRQAGNTADMLTATQLPDAIRLELERVGLIGGIDALAGRCNPLTVPLPATLKLTADRFGYRVQTEDYLSASGGARFPTESRYFLIEIWRHNAAPLAYEPGSRLLALQVRVSWPYHVPGATSPTNLEHREQITFSLALSPGDGP